MLLLVVALVVRVAGVPLPDARQLEYMEMELTQFMHFGAPTFWDPPAYYLNETNPTMHNCKTTTIDHGNQTKGYYPCLNPDVFNPTHLDAHNWMEASVAMGMKEICITAHHEGGFALWPSKYTDYGVHASAWRNGSGDVLREFVDAANHWGVKICYYLNVQNDGYMTKVAKYSPTEFIRRQVGMIEEVLEHYGPVNRFWFDGTRSVPDHTNLHELWESVYAAIRKSSPSTMITPYRGDVCMSTETLYTRAGPQPNSSDLSLCGKTSETAQYFVPTEMHGITIQEGPDGNTDAVPTFWFWRPWACPNATYRPTCPWVGHANSSRVFDAYLVTVGHGATLLMNIPPDRSGRMNTSVNQVMHEVGKAINDTFHTSVAEKKSVSGTCATGVVILETPPHAPFDYIMTMEDLRYGQRIANYSIEFQREGSSTWEMLVPPVLPPKATDRPDGHDPRDAHVGHKRIDLPIVPTSGAAAVPIARVRFNCIRSLEDPIHIRSFSTHKKSVPWEK